MQLIRRSHLGLLSYDKCTLLELRQFIDSRGLSRSGEKKPSKK